MSAVADTAMSNMSEAAMDIWNIGATASGAASSTRGASQLATEASSTRVSSQPPSGGAPQPAVQELVRAPQPVATPLSLAG